MRLELSPGDEAALRGDAGPAAQWAMQMLLRVAQQAAAARLIDITQAHLVGSYHSGLANLRLLRQLADWGARVAVETTLNSSAADLQRQIPGSRSEEFRANCAVVRAYQQMGCRIELTCAPYQLPTRPLAGENLAWAESNAVVFANSVLGARTNLTYQYLDLAAALTGRMPEYGLYLQPQRAGQILFEIEGVPPRWWHEAALYPLLGYLIGQHSGAAIPVIRGLEAEVAEDSWRALGAAAASSGKVAMFHAVGCTPEAATLEAALQSRAPERIIRIGPQELLSARAQLGGNAAATVPSAICLGAPHYSLTECARLAEALAGRRVSPATRLIVSTSRHNRRELQRTGLLEGLEAAGIELISDTCTYYGRELLGLRGTVMTDSAKWALYAPGNLGVAAVFARLSDCVESAVAGKLMLDESFWSI